MLKKSSFKSSLLFVSFLAFLIGAFFVFSHPTAKADVNVYDTGWKAPAAYTSVGGIAWTNPNKAYAEDDVFTTASSTYSRVMNQGYTNFGLNLPVDGTTITGIEVKIKAKVSSGTTQKLAVNLYTATPYPYPFGNYYTSKQTSNLTTSSQWYTLGSDTDLWGRSSSDWMQSGLSDNTFKMALAKTVTANVTYSVDAIQIKVYYTATSLADTGYKTPTNNGTYAADWTDPANAYVEDSNSATADLEPWNEAVQSYENFDFNIPDDATIQGVKVYINGQSDYSSDNPYISLCSINGCSDPKQPAQSANGQVLGYWNDLWVGGWQTWTPADFSNDNFWAKVDVIDNYGEPESTYLDALKIKVYYTEFVPTATSTIHAVSGGGNWSEASTWQEGVVPTSTNPVVISGTIYIDMDAGAPSLVVNSGAVLKNISASSTTLTINGDVTNNGTISDNTSETLSLNITDNIVNNGTWNNSAVNLVWPIYFGADSYQLYLSDASSTWPEPITVTDNHYNIAGHLDASAYWYARASVNSLLMPATDIRALNLSNILSFSNISSPQIASTTFAVTITALDLGGSTSTLSGTVNLSTTSGTTTPSSVTLSNGTWSGNVSTNATGTAVRLLASAASPKSVGLSNALEVRPIILDNLAYDNWGTTVWDSGHNCDSVYGTGATTWQRFPYTATSSPTKFSIAAYGAQGWGTEPGQVRMACYGTSTSPIWSTSWTALCGTLNNSYCNFSGLSDSQKLDRLATVNYVVTDSQKQAFMGIINSIAYCRVELQDQYPNLGAHGSYNYLFHYPKTDYTMDGSCTASHDTGNGIVGNLDLMLKVYTNIVPITSTYCGDGACNNNETVQTCVLDCLAQSVSGGGDWSATSTWSAGVVPTSSMAVEINGPVYLGGDASIAKLTINSGGALRNAADSTSSLAISGDVVNNGTIDDYASSTLSLNISGHAINNGIWNNAANNLVWPAVSGAAYYQLSLSDASNTWPALITTNDNYYDLADRLDARGYWQVRASVNNVLTAPTSLKALNISKTLSFSDITSPRVTDTPFSVTVSALDLNGNATTTSGTVYLSATNGTTSPSSITLSNGTWTGNLSLGTVGTAVKLLASSTTTKIFGSSNAFNIRLASTTDVLLYSNWNANASVVNSSDTCRHNYQPFPITGNTPPAYFKLGATRWVGGSWNAYATVRMACYNASGTLVWTTGSALMQGAFSSLSDMRDHAAYYLSAAEQASWVTAYQNTQPLSCQIETDDQWANPYYGYYNFLAAATDSYKITGGCMSSGHPNDALNIEVYYNQSTPYCGDNTCNGSETCSTCAADCGECNVVHSRAGGGNWSYTGTWVEGHVPAVTDKVEINGTVKVDIASTTVAGLKVNNGGVLQDKFWVNSTVTVNGNVINNGRIVWGNIFGSLKLKVSGNITAANYNSWYMVDVDVFWPEVSGVQGYQAEIFDYSGSNYSSSTVNVAANHHTVSNSAFFINSISLDEGYWRVRADFGNGDYGAWSNIKTLNSQYRAVLSLDPASQQKAGQPYNATTTVVDLDGNPVTNYNDELSLTTSNGGPVLPGTITITNGTWSGSLAIGKGGDDIRILARADDLVGESESVSIVKRNPVIIMPGTFGTWLMNGINPVIPLWPDFAGTYLDQLTMLDSGLPNSNYPVLPTGIVRTLTNPFTLETTHFYDDLISELENNGYTENEDLFTFPYDWRLNIGTNSELFRDKIFEVKMLTGASKVDVIAHSQGGLVFKKYVMDCADNQYCDHNSIDKFVDIATPHLGLPFAFKALTYGDNLGSSGLSLSVGVLKSLAQNFPAMYQMLPSRKYVGDASTTSPIDSYNGSLNPYINDVYGYAQDGVTGTLDYAQSIAFMATTSRNTNLLPLNDTFHEQTDEFYPSNYGISAYNIVGCRQPTIGDIKIINYHETEDPEYSESTPVTQRIEYILDYINGDGTVPLDSATYLHDSIKTYYNSTFENSSSTHSILPSLYGNRQLIASVLNGTQNSFNFSQYSDISENDSNCTLNGQTISVHSPITLNAYDENGNHVGPTQDGKTEINIPGAAYDIIGDNKFVFLPSGHNYRITGQATDKGHFNVRIRKIENSQTTETAYYNQLPLDSTSTSMEIGFSNNKPDYSLKIYKKGHNFSATRFQPSAVLNKQESADLTRPSTQIKSEKIKGKIGANIVFSAQDNKGGAGILKTEYSLDNGRTWNLYSDKFALASEGQYDIQFMTTDRAGNIEIVKESQVDIRKNDVLVKEVERHKLNKDNINIR
jgi:hypothetical protein